MIVECYVRAINLAYALAHVRQGQKAPNAKSLVGKGQLMAPIISKSSLFI